VGSARVAIVAGGLVLLLAGCGRVPESLLPSPTPFDTPTLTTASPTAESGASPSPLNTHQPSPSTRAAITPSAAPRTSPRTTPSPTPPLAISSLPVHAGDVGFSYTPVQLVASGGTKPYSWAVIGGSAAFPPGLTLATDGIVSGVPSSAGGFKFTVQVADAGGSADTAGASITINRPLAASAVCAATVCQVERLCIDVCGGLGSQSGGTPPYKYTASGTLPTGTTLNGLALAGQFTAVGKWSFGVTITDALGAATSLKANFSVFAHIALKGGTFNGKPGVSFVIALPYSGGTPGGIPVVALLKGSLPPGTTFVVNPKLFEVDVSVPAQKLSASYTAVFGLTDQSPCSSTSSCKTSATVVINIG
jgi:hypothetical protein